MTRAYAAMAVNGNVEHRVYVVVGVCMIGCGVCSSEWVWSSVSVVDVKDDNEDAVVVVVVNVAAVKVYFCCRRGSYYY